MELIYSKCLLKPILFTKEILVCVHKTCLKSLELIIKIDFCHMKKIYVHFTRDLSTNNGVTSKMHNNYEMMIYLDV